MIRIVLPLAATAALAGCTYDTRPEPPAPGIECNANRLHNVIGKKRSAKVEAHAKRQSGANVVRWLEPGAIVTLEFRSDRLNLDLNRNGRITGARCG